MRRSRSQTISFLGFEYDPKIEATCRKLNFKRQRHAKESKRAESHSPEMADQLFGQMGRPMPAHSTASCIAKPTIEAENFELRTHLIQFIERNQFGGPAAENPHDHLSDFLEKCDTIPINRVTPDAI